jgi:hypothetical protein
MQTRSPDSATNDFEIVHEVTTSSSCEWYLVLFKPQFAVVARSPRLALPALHTSLTMDQEKKTEIVVSVRPVYFSMPSNDSTRMKKFRDNEDDEISSQGSTAVTLEEAEAGTANAKWYRRNRANSVKRWLGQSTSAKATRRQKWCRWLLIVFVVLGLLGTIAAM